MEMTSYSLVSFIEDGKRWYVRNINLDYPIEESALSYTDNKEEAMELETQDFLWWMKKIPHQFHGHLIESYSLFIKIKK